MLEAVIADRCLDFAREYIVRAAERYCELCDKKFSELSIFEINEIIQILTFRGGKNVKVEEIF